MTTHDRAAPRYEQGLDERGRDEKGEWRPAKPIVPAPISEWPPQPIKTFHWLFGRPGYIWPENLFWLAVSLLTWVFLTPELATMKELAWDWVLLILLRNFVLIGLVFGGMHYFLYIRKSQGDELRYTTKPFPANSKRFRFGHQVRDNMFHTLVYAVPIFTVYEVITYWLFANNLIGFINLTSPVAFWGWFVLLLLIAPIIHMLHFYVGHRLLHVKALYKHVHSLHHRNVQVGPWSGLSMHPVEHVIYFSTVVVQWLIALHPLNALYQIHLAAFQPAPGHCGFEKMRVCKGFDLAAGSNFHYQHHKHFECNYGGSVMPLDKWFGTFHDGTREADVRLREKLRARRRANAIG